MALDLPLHSAVPALQVKRADSFRARLFGLLALPRLQPGEALALKPCSSVHTFFMSYPIDVVYVDRDGCVLKVVPALAPWRLSGCWGARTTLELAAGEAERLQLRPGSRVDAG